MSDATPLEEVPKPSSSNCQPKSHDDTLPTHSVTPCNETGEPLPIATQQPSAETFSISAQSIKSLSTGDSDATGQTFEDSRAQIVDLSSSKESPSQCIPNYTPTSTTLSVTESALKDEIANGLIRRSIGIPDLDHEVEKSNITTIAEKASSNPTAEPLSEKSKTLVNFRIPSPRQFRNQVFNAYQRLFSLVFIVNIIAFVWVLTKHRNSHPFGPSLDHVATATAANITGAILMRQEYVVNALYTIFCWTPHSFPLRVRRAIAKVYHFGGVHSGAAVSATVWYLLFTVLLTKQYIEGSFESIPILTITYVLIALLLLICILAYPRLRFRSHDTFENVHRLGGWLAVGLFWTETILIAFKQSNNPDSQSAGHVLIQTPAFWFLIVITLSIALPWLRLRKVQCWTEILSPTAARLHFNYSVVGVVVGIRIANHPLKEWHPFATIPEKDGSSFHIVLTAVGDWTHKQINEPVYSYWVRGIPLIGVLRMAVIFKRVVIVTTGSGIGPVLSLLVNHTMPCRIIWSAQRPAEVWGQSTIDAVRRADPEALIVGKINGKRPDLKGLAGQLYKQSNAEAVFVISNIQSTYEIVDYLNNSSIPAYGPIWDS
ncbi:uncharacterized protein KY384_005561 [Bacidia gigantensis]|uniref:uncharacterized protein n=1 Tax=Bacidia gigantensis TaxID=2732470 RepID=UPI001D0392E8|nr:uncharacterized protein KY384_005561 [Bacidia gigantensis]KAG8530079.1 hypothetical protein KY384_005561 [Bacidia gigantensis]